MGTEASTGGAPASTGAAASTGAPASSGVAASMGAAAFTWGDGWRQHIAHGSTDPEKELKQLERYESPEQVWKKARELERRMSAGELRPILPKNASPDEVKAYRAAHGIPEAPEGYKVDMPAGKEPPKEDDAFLKAFQKSAHEANYSQDQFNAAVAMFYSEVDRQQEAISEAERELEQKTEDQLRQEWQGDYRANKAMAEALLARAPQGFRDRFMNGYLADHTPIRASAEAWKWLVQMEREINPAATVVPGSTANVGQTVEAELIELKKLMGDQNSKYWKGPEADKLQARYRDLLTAQEKLKAKAA